MFESIFEVTADATLSTGSAILGILSGLALGLVVSLTYARCNKSRGEINNFLLTLIVLPGIIAMIIMLVGSNVARAFSLAGAFSLVRFRSAPGDPKDIAYICIVMAIGLATGMGYVFFAAIFAVILCLVLLAFSLFDRRSSRDIRLIKITVPEDLNFNGAFDDIFDQFTTSHRLIRMRTADLGSVIKLEYSVTLRDQTNEKEFLNQLRARNGNMDIIFLMLLPDSVSQ